MPRIPVVPYAKASRLTRFFYRFAKRKFGAVPEPMSVLAHHPGALMSWTLMEGSLEKALRALPGSLRDLAVYRVATVVGCSWCVDFGTMKQRLDGLDIDRLREIDDYVTSDRFTETEKRALAYADAMTAQPPTVTDEQVAELDAELGHKGLAELTFVIGVENLRARCFHALGIVDQGFTSGDACQVPLP
jgi:AhpD family alkylhydroperoxidase